MDKFEKHIKKQYDRQLKPVNPKAAWANFEAERLGKEKDRKWLWLFFLIAGVGVTGSWLMFFSSASSTVDQETVIVSESTISKASTTPEEVTSLLIGNLEKDRRVNSSDMVLNKKDAVSKVTNRTEDLDEGKGTHANEAHVNDVPSKSDRDISRNDLNRINGQEINVFAHSEIVQESIFDVKNQENPAVESSLGKENVPVIHNNEGLAEQVAGSSLESAEIGKVKSNQREAAEIGDVSTPLSPTLPLNVHSRWISYGVYTGYNTLHHRFIRKSNGVNLGLVLQARLTKRMSIHALAGYSFINFETRVNSKDLRIKSLNINTRRLEVNSINKSVHQLNSGLELALWPVKNKRFGIDLTAGVIAKVDVMESHDYEVFENDMNGEIQQSNSLNYYYPAFYRVSSGISYSWNKTRIVLRPYYMHNVFASEINHPYEFGINTEILF